MVLNSKSKLLNENVIQIGATKLLIEGYIDTSFCLRFWSSTFISSSVFTFLSSMLSSKAG